MYPRSFLCAEAKIKQCTPLKKELYENDEEAIWESRFTSFFFFFDSVKYYSLRCVEPFIYFCLIKFSSKINEKNFP